MDMGLKTVVLAAGEGKRMKSRLPKVLHKILGETLLQHVLSSVFASGVGSEVAVVVGQDESVALSVKEPVSFFVQKEQLGTGHAVMMAEDFLEDGKHILVLCGDTPLLRPETIASLARQHIEKNNAFTVLSVNIKDPTGYGRIVRKNGAFEAIVEHRDATEEQKNISEINTGVYCFDAKKLKWALSKLTNQNSQQEYYLTDVLTILQANNHSGTALTTDDSEQFLGVNTRVQLAEAAETMKKRINRRHMEEGVTLQDPNNTYIHPNVKIGADTVVAPNVCLEGNTVIGENCIIGANSHLVDMHIGNHVVIDSSKLVESTIGDYTTVGPFAYVRPHCQVGQHVKVGDFVEIKNAIIGDHTKMSHLTYVGDADVGSHINFGCGCITVNYDGESKFRTVVEDNVFIGCNTNLVAPVTVAKGAYIAAGSTITHDVPTLTLAIARSKQVIKENWKKKQKK